MDDTQIVISCQEGKQQLAMDTVDNVSFSVYGGSRGCFTGSTEFLTSSGDWVRFDEFEKLECAVEIAAFDTTTNSIVYEIPERFIKLPCDIFVSFVGEEVNHKVSTEHTLYLFDNDMVAYKFPISDIIGWKCIGDRLRRDLFMYDPLANKLKSLSDVKIEVHKEPDYKYCFETSTGALVVRHNGNVSVSGNSGKSYLLNMLPLKHCLDDPNYHAVAFRREYKEITMPGGIWQTACELYPLFGAKPNIANLTWKFPIGSTVVFSHMFTENDAETWRGSQLSAILMDEINKFSGYQISFMMTCLRSKSKNDSYLFGTANPDVDHAYLLEFITPYLDEIGYPREDMCGVVRYFLVIGGDVKTAATAEELIEKYPDAVNVINPNTGESVFVPPKTFTFIGGTIFDNPKLIQANPAYLSELQNLPDHERQRQLYGNWFIRPTASNYFQRDWLVEVDTFPAKAKCCRAWDKSATEVSEVNKRPDFTACSPKIYMHEGLYYLVWDVHPDIKDVRGNDKNITGKFRLRAGERDLKILRQAQHDGKECHVVFPVDPGAAGKTEYESSAKVLTGQGFIVKKDPMPNNKSKLIRFQPFAAACQNGLVRIVRSSFSNDATYEEFMRELEAFTGERSSTGRHDDAADATASAFNYISKMKTIRDFTLPTPTGNSATVLSALKF